ncbi:MAG: creatininase family protein [Microcystis sp. M54BS1]|jgi:creatinine amidohydrolase|uniref:creatininase family protein n=1 Tax=unclassified Microcystis TaxID=2643300 RepID=UPI00257C5CB5|nr:MULTISPECIES: creatininase family protein [unclassified Microcystis]MCA2538913.1 creatininase family protein [Microcystis sp. M54BS1]MCA2596557.1 creatininase family protein [Microcystis sp. M38BS1]MCA2611966.1 creatininase family protein [Microcystis sp. M27BS1]NCR76459.1 creatininase family protein [Microcystis aeruginosa K13-06]MCA2504788.1 creatininase family protein [Microcystis sp. M62BS1]
MNNFAQINTEQVYDYLQEKILFLPIGAIEQHGPHLPLSVDCVIPEKICHELALRLNGLVAPTINYGARSLPQSGGGLDFLGTIYVRGSTLIDYVHDIIQAYIVSGARYIIILNGHYENEGFIFEAIDQLREKNTLNSISLIALSWWSVINTSLVAELFGKNFVGWHAEHASLVETSLMLYLQPVGINSIRVNNSTPPEAGIFFYPRDPKQVSCRGVLHRTLEASAQAGEILFKEIVQKLETTISCHLHEWLISNNTNSNILIKEKND